MTNAEIERIKTDLALLRARGGSVFGSGAHAFELEPVLTEDLVAAFETRHGVRLPADYRAFLTQVGSGGAGPYYGLFPFGLTDDGHGFREWQEADGFVGVLHRDFPYSTSWNDLSGEPDESLNDSDEDEYWRQTEVFEKRYCAPLDGAIPICHLGCALRQWLVISGPEAGHIWSDDRADNNGLSPLSLKGHERVSFHTWYRIWLDEALALSSASE